MGAGEASPARQAAGRGDAQWRRIDLEIVISRYNTPSNLEYFYRFIVNVEKNFLEIQ